MLTGPMVGDMSSGGFLHKLSQHATGNTCGNDKLLSTYLHLLDRVHLVSPQGVEQLALDAFAVVGGLALSVDQAQHVLLVGRTLLNVL